MLGTALWRLDIAVLVYAYELMRRFNILVLNYQRLQSFLNNFDKIQAFDPLQDKVTILTCSPSEEETRQIKDFSAKYQLNLEYLIRRNFGIDQGARVEFFTGKINGLEQVWDCEYIFQFQEHYLDPRAPYSKWGENENFRVKGDVVPDNVSFNLDSLIHIFRKNKIAAAFCDRNNPCWFQRAGATHIAPNGGNFILHAQEIQNQNVQRELKRIYRRCDNTYRWALYAEYKWGELFFNEGKRYYDLKREKIYTKFPTEEFYLSPDPVDELYESYQENLLTRLIKKSIRVTEKLLTKR